MKTFEQHNISKVAEIFFLELAHLDKLEIKFDFINYRQDLFYFYNERCLFDYDKIGKYFWIDYNKIWSPMNLSYNQINEFMSIMINKHFNLMINVDWLDFKDYRF